jgi:hypothetical protein
MVYHKICCMRRLLKLHFDNEEFVDHVPGGLAVDDSCGGRKRIETTPVAQAGTCKSTIGRFFRTVVT